MLTDSNGKAAVHGKYKINIDITGINVAAYRALGQVLPTQLSTFIFSWIFTPA